MTFAERDLNFILELHIAVLGKPKFQQHIGDSAIFFVPKKCFHTFIVTGRKRIKTTCSETRPKGNIIKA